MRRQLSSIGCALLCVAVLNGARADAQTAAADGAKTADQYKPVVGQPGKDAVWVPTTQAMVEKMLDMAKVTPKDYVIDLGSGDGRAVIAAAKRGARALGVEYNNDLVDLSRRAAKEAGVADKASFQQGDMYAADISKATVLALFLLPSNLKKLEPKFLDLTPGTRIVANTFWIEGWEPDATETLKENCDSWCNAHLFIIPAKAQGTWRAPHGDLTLTQEYQTVSGTFTTSEGEKLAVKGRLRGDQLTMTVGDREYTGVVKGDTIEGRDAAGGETVVAKRVVQQSFKPTVGQSGKDVVWVPTPAILVDKMLDMAHVTPQDIVMDLGSGDGRNIIAAAKRGATAIGVEYNAEMVALSRKAAEEAGVAGKATFVQGDMYEADISKATVLALFLLPHNLNKLTPKFLDLPPGTRIVGNTFAPEGWTADETETVEGDCVSWCTSLLWIVPAKVAGTWKLPQGELTLRQAFQVVSGTLASGGKTVEVAGKLRGDQLTLTGPGLDLRGKVRGDTIEGDGFKAEKQGAQ